MPRSRPAIAAIAEPASTPNFAIASDAGSVNARAAMKMDIVKPMPPRKPMTAMPAGDTRAVLTGLIGR